MSYRNFGDLVEGFTAYWGRTAITIRPFIKIERLNYRDLQNRIYQTANYLTAQKIKSGDRIMIVAPNSPQWVELFLGAQLLGAVVVTVDAMTELATAEGYIKQTKPELIFRGQPILAQLDKNHKTVVIDQLDQLIESFDSGPPKNKPSGKLIAVIVFTSGTTADPKGVPLTQRNILANIEAIQEAIDIRPSWRFLSVLPLSHMYELTDGCLTELACGCSIYYLPRVTPMAIASALQDYHITTILTIPQLTILLLGRIRQTAEEQGKDRGLASAMILGEHLPMPLRRIVFRTVHSHLGGKLDLVVNGGAPTPPAAAKAWESMGVKIIQGYGLTETSPILTVNTLAYRPFDSVGKPLDNVKLRIGEGGEILAKGPSVFSGYYNNPAADKAAFTSDGWFKTGDTGRLDEGYLKIQGRLKFVIVLPNGLKVFPEDVELVADKHPEFKEICIVGVSRGSEESVNAVVISDQSDSAITKAILQINHQLADFQHIAAWRRWPEADFPRTRLLKIDRRKVQDWANRPGNATTASEKVGLDQDKLQKIIHLSLSDSAVSVHEKDRLADLGLDSLRRLNMVALIEQQIGVTIDESLVKPSTTVSQMRQLIAQGTTTEAPEPRSTWTYNKLVRLIGNSLRELVIRGIVRIWVKTTIEGRDNLKALRTPAIFIFNHLDDFDGPVIFNSLPWPIRRRLSVAAADDVMNRHKILAVIIRLCFAGFNMARQQPYLPSLRYIGQMVDQGWNVLLSPEGRITTSGRLQPFKSGIGLLAVELGLPVVVVKTSGLRGTVPLHAKWPKKHSAVTVKISRPISFDRATSYDDATAKLHKLMVSL